MPAKPLTDEQKRDAARLFGYFKAWQSARRELGLTWQQGEVAEELFGFGQSALSQYINGKIPLNAEALGKFAAVLGVRADNISPSIVRHYKAMTETLMLVERDIPPERVGIGAAQPKDADGLPGSSSGKRAVRAA